MESTNKRWLLWMLLAGASWVGKLVVESGVNTSCWSQWQHHPALNWASGPCASWKAQLMLT